MKKLLFAVLLGTALTSLAEEPPNEMYMANDAGGYVVLTIEKCRLDTVVLQYPYRAYATESSALVHHEGCWSSPSTDQLPTELLSKSEGAGEPPTIRIIKMVNTFWDEGGTATFLQSAFSSKKKSNSGL
jgi:hypothetical protein